MYSTYAVYLDFIYLHTWINFASQTIYEISFSKNSTICPTSLEYSYLTSKYLLIPQVKYKLLINKLSVWLPTILGFKKYQGQKWAGSKMI